jgi:phage-related protein
MQIEFYTKSNGKSPVEEYIKDLQKHEQARLLACLKSVEDMGFDSPRVQFRQIEGPLWEIKIRSENSHRIFYVSVKGNRIVLLHAYRKESQKAPLKEIATAEKRMEEILNEENQNFNRSNK